MDYKKSVELLKKYAYHYYVLDEPLVSDFEYDSLYHEVKKYEDTHKAFVRFLMLHIRFLMRHTEACRFALSHSDRRLS